MELVNYAEFITVDPEIRGGKPCIRGMRVTVSDVLDMLASDMSPEQIDTDFPYLTREDVRACLAFAADRERKINDRVARANEFRCPDARQFCRRREGARGATESSAQTALFGGAERVPYFAGTCLWISAPVCGYKFAGAHLRRIRT